MKTEDREWVSRWVGKWVRTPFSLTGLLTLSLTVFPLSLTGCMSAGRLVRELARDPATVSLEIHSVYGTIIYKRANPGTNTAPHALTADGTLTIH